MTQIMILPEKLLEVLEDYKIESLKELEMRQILKVMKLTDRNISVCSSIENQQKHYI